MRVLAKVHGSLAQSGEANYQHWFRGWQNVVHDETERAKRQLRAKLRPHFKRRGGAVVNAIRSAHYRQDLAGVVFAKGSVNKIIATHMHGAEIRPRSGKVLFTRWRLTRGRSDAGIRSAKDIFDNARAGTVRIIKIGGNRSLVIRETKSRSYILGFLVPQVTIKAKVNLAALLNDTEQRIVAGAVQVVRER